MDSIEATHLQRETETDIPWVGMWSCPACTLVSSDPFECIACGSKREYSLSSVTGSDTIDLLDSEEEECWEEEEEDASAYLMSWSCVHCHNTFGCEVEACPQCLAEDEDAKTVAAFPGAVASTVCLAQLEDTQNRTVNIIERLSECYRTALTEKSAKPSGNVKKRARTVAVQPPHHIRLCATGEL